MKVVGVALSLLDIFHKVVSFHHPGISLNQTRVHKLRKSDTGNQIKRHERVDNQVETEEGLEGEDGQALTSFNTNAFENVLVLLVQSICFKVVHDSTQSREEASKGQVEHQEVVQYNLKAGAFKDVPTEVHNQFGLVASVDYYGEGITGVLEESSSVDELIETERVVAHLAILVIMQDTASESIESFQGFNILDFNMLVRAFFKNLIELLMDLLDSHLGL